MTNDIKSQVLSIVKDIELGMKYEECPDCGSTNFDEHNDCECGNHMMLSGFDYISDVLDFNYVINSDRTYRGTRLLVAFGGPNIWVDTSTNTVTGGWWGDSYSATYSRDAMDIDGACEELFGCV
jgi:hypothetical protein|tara:strand:- start:116 stop:487 length:372 start_codon:yes stop_codon:yes gene_type:complete